jgi:hypothetical protein
MNKKIIFSLLLTTGISAYGMNHNRRSNVSYNPTEVHFSVLLKKEENKITDSREQQSPEKKDLAKQKVVLPRLFIVQAKL